jgi:hypothetical protein
MKSFTLMIWVALGIGVSAPVSAQDSARVLPGRVKPGRIVSDSIHLVPTRPLEEKSKLHAYAVAAIGTVAPIGLMTVLITSGTASDGVIFGSLALSVVAGFGPSWGQFYADSKGPGWWGVGVRGFGSTLAAFGLMNNFFAGFCGRGEEDVPYSQRKVCPEDPGNGALFTGLGIFAVGTVYSLIETGYGVDRANARVRAQRFGWSPTVIPGADGTLRAGGLAWMRF